MANIYVAASATWNGKALKKAKKDVSIFDQQVKSLGKTFAGVFGARALFNYGKNAVKAFAADEAAAKALELQLRNTGNAFAAPAVEYYIANLQKTTGVLDDQLRPAFQQLLTVTNSVAQSQAALDTALNVSAATGKSLTEVAAALSKGFAGNTTALTRLGAGLDKATLKSGKMDDILKQLNQKFAGQAAARLDTYAGKMSLLQVAAADASETIGKSLIDALNKLGKNEDIKDLTDDINKMAVGIASIISGLGELTSVLSTLRQTTGFKQLFDILFGTNIFSLLGKLGDISVPAPTSNFTYSLGPSAIKDVDRANLILAANKARTKELALIKEKNALEALKMKYDVERIGLMLALNNATDEETRLRIAEKLAILDGNAAKAKEYVEIGNATSLRTAEIESIKTLTAAQYLAATQMTKLADWAEYRAGERASATALAATGKAATVGGMSFTPAPTMTMASDYAAYRASERGDVIVNVAGSVLTEQDLTDTIQRTILQINKQGRGTTPAGGLSGGT